MSSNQSRAFNLTCLTINRKSVRANLLTNPNNKQQMRTRLSVQRELVNDLVSGEIPTSRKSIVQVPDLKIHGVNRELLNSLSEEVAASPINGFAGLVNFGPTAHRPIHRWFWYREGYSIDLVKELIKELPKGSVVLDPFCGAGTTLLASRELGLPSVGCDVNPISILVSKVKTRNYDSQTKEEIATQIALLKRAKKSMLADDKPRLQIIDKVYDADVLHALLVYRRQINGISTPEVRDFLFVAWLSILEQVSNVYKEGNGIKYRNRKRTDNGYIQVDLSAWQTAALPEDRFAYVKAVLLNKLAEMQGDLELMPKRQINATVIEDGAENLTKHLHENSVAMAVFSPPYCNCFNYFKMYKVELWMGGFVESYDDLKVLNRRGLRSHVETILKRTDDFEVPEVEQYAKLLDGLELWDKRIPNAVRGYFIDMSKVLESLVKVLKPTGKAVIVVGNSAYGGVVIPTDALLAKIATRVGFRVEKLSVARSLTTSSQQRSMLGDRMSYLRESILILVKDDPRLIDRELIPVDELPIEDAARRNQVFAIKNSGLTAGPHKFHRYPGKFIPHLPRWAIQRYIGKTSNKFLLDPFCGSGTTLVEARLHNVPSFGIDVDPIAKLVSRVKTRTIDIPRLENAISKLAQKLGSAERARFCPAISTLSHWFNEKAIRDLGIIRDAIEEYREEVEIYEFLLVCFVAIIRRASNADNQTQKTYVSHTKLKNPPPAIPLFLETLIDYSARSTEFAKKVKTSAPARIIDGCDARNFSDLWATQNLPNIDLIVSSPPYLNSVDYVYNQMAEYFWVGDLYEMETQAKQNEHKRNYVGTMKVDASTYKNQLVTGLDQVDTVIAAVAKKSQKNGYVVAKYFKDMLSHFDEASKILRPGGHYVSIVGDSLVSGEPIMVHELVAECAKSAGFSLEGRFGYEIRNRHMRFPRMGRGGIVRYDWILEMVKA